MTVALEPALTLPLPHDAAWPDAALLDAALLDAALLDEELAVLTAELSRRGFLGGLAGTAGLLGLAGCGSSGEPAGSASAPASRQIDTARGKVSVPADPQRVVAIQPSATATLYDLGIAPVGVYNQGAGYISPRYRDRWTAATKIGTAGQIDVEKVAALNPDLIIGVDFEWNTNVYAKLSKLAPTVIAPTTSWQATAHTTADAVNKLGALSGLQQQLGVRSAEIRSRYAPVLARYRWDILQGGFDKGQYWLYGPDSDAGSILAAAGVRFATGSARVTTAGNQSQSYERIDVLGDAGVIGYYANYDGTPNNEGPQLFAQAGFTKLDAVRAKRLVPLPDFLPGGYGDALALLQELEAGLKKLAG